MEVQEIQDQQDETGPQVNLTIDTEYQPAGEGMVNRQTHKDRRTSQEQQSRENTYCLIAVSVFSCIFCCPICGAWACYSSNLALGANERGDIPAAEHHTRAAISCIIMSIVAGIMTLMVAVPLVSSTVASLQDP